MNLARKIQVKVRKNLFPNLEGFFSMFTHFEAHARPENRPRWMGWKVVQTTVGWVLSFFAIVLVLGLTLLLMLGLIQTAKEVADAFMNRPMSEAWQLAISNVLSLLIVFELIVGIIAYLVHERLPIRYLVDATLVFVFRELMVGLYKGQLTGTEMLGYSVVIASLGVVRILAIVRSPGDAQTLARGLKEANEDTGVGVSVPRSPNRSE